MLNLRVDDRELKRAFRQLQDRQIPYAIAGALNAVAEGAKADLRAEMTKVFDRPTPYTLNAFYVSKAGPRRLEASIQTRSFNGTPYEYYIGPQVQGGPRRMKRLELRLSALSGGQYIVPGRGARLDQYGNISRGQIGQIISRLGAAGDPYQNMTDKTTRRLAKKGLIAKGAKSEYFIVRSKIGNKRPLGVWQLTGKGKVAPVLIFTPKVPTYKKRFDPEKVVLEAMSRYSDTAIEQSLAHELATAK